MPSNPTQPTGHRTRIAVVMDPIDSIKPAKDSTLAMMLAAQKRGWEILYLEQRDLWLADGVAWGRVRPIQVRDDLQNWATLGAIKIERLGSIDAILMRKDPPFDMEYIYTTYILERAEAEGALVVNRPQGLRDMIAFRPWLVVPLTRLLHVQLRLHRLVLQHRNSCCTPRAD